MINNMNKLHNGAIRGMDEPKEKYANCRGAKLMEVVVVEVNEGEGTQDDPIIRVLYIYSKEGKLLAQTKDIDRLYKENDFMKI